MKKLKIIRPRVKPLPNVRKCNGVAPSVVKFLRELANFAKVVVTLLLSSFVTLMLRGTFSVVSFRTILLPDMDEKANLVLLVCCSLTIVVVSS